VAWCRYVLVDSCWCSRIPAECSHAECAAVMRPGLQAYTALHYQLRIAKGDTILITRGYVRTCLQYWSSVVHPPLRDNASSPSPCFNS
jgi:hypothetical protein